MVKTTITVTNPKGIHARPSAMIVKTVNQFDAEITFECHGNKIDGKSIISILTLAAACGDVLHVTADGPQEQEAMDALVEIFALKFNDD